MSIFTAEYRELLAVLAPYLEHEIEVETPSHGRGVLIGLPFCQAPSEKPRAEVRMPYGGCYEVYELAHIKPVLIRPTAMDMAVLRHTAQQDPAGAVDGYRKMHFALGLKPEQYIEKPNPYRS